jgi:periplasmic protein TonB
MFEKLIVSTSQRRKGRTATFFICTSIVYLSVIALAFVLSVLLADPRLADTSDSITRIAMLAPPTIGHTPHGPATHSDSGGVPRQDLNNLRKLDDIVNHPQTGSSPIHLPGRMAFSAEQGAPYGDEHGVIVGIDIPGSSAHGNEPPPRPVDPPTPQPRPAVDKKPLLVSSTVLQGKAIERRVPAYPELVRRIRLQGEVAVEVIISPEGRVESARAISGHPMLIAASLEAARGWRFGPTFLNGVPVRVTGVITFVFKLTE